MGAKSNIFNYTQQPSRIDEFVEVINEQTLDILGARQIEVYNTNGQLSHSDQTT